LQRTTAWPAVNAHPDLQALVVLQRPADLKGALRRFLRTFIEHQRHAVAGRDFQYTIGRFSFLELLGQANNPVEFINSGVLFVNGEFRVADDVEEENVRDLKLDLLLNFGGHVVKLSENKANQQLWFCLTVQLKTHAYQVCAHPRSQFAHS